MTPVQRRHVLLGPIRVWGALLALLGLTIVYAFVPGAPLKTAVALTIGGAKGMIIALLFMQLRQATGIVRLAALFGLVWASFLFLFAFTDVLTR